MTVHVYNGEPVDGWLQLARYDMWGEGEAVRVPGNSAVEIGRIYDAPPNQLWLIPYLSLNRREIRLVLADPEPRSSADTDGFVGTRPSTWIRPKVDGIVVDDLDPGQRRALRCSRFFSYHRGDFAMLAVIARAAEWR